MTDQRLSDMAEKYVRDHPVPPCPDNLFQDEWDDLHRIEAFKAGAAALEARVEEVEAENERLRTALNDILFFDPPNASFETIHKIQVIAGTALAEARQETTR